ncbi:hypothetical protein ABE527_14240 [Brucella sp. TWI432]
MKKPTRRRWNNAKSAHVGYWTGKGRSSREIAEILADGTTSHTIRRQWYNWHLPSHGKAQKLVFVNVPMSYQDRLVINRRALRIGISPEEFIRRVALCAAKDDLYQAVTDGRFSK